MTAEEKVKEVYPEAFCYRMFPKIFYIIRKEGALGSLGVGNTTARAWADALRNIQKQGGSK